MSLWTPGGEHTPEPRPQPQPEADHQGANVGAGAGADPNLADLSPEERARLETMEAEMAEVRRQLLAAPASVVVANHAMGLYELAAIHLTAEAPRLAEASLAIDAVAALVEGLAGRLGESEPTLQGALGQLRATYLEVRAHHAHSGESSDRPPGAPGA